MKGTAVHPPAPRVLHVVWNLIRGGTEGQCARVALALASQGHRVAVSERAGYFLEAVERACGPVHELRIRRFLSLDTVREVHRLADFIRDASIDVVHAWDADAAIFGSWAAHRAGRPYITSRRDLGQIYSRHKAWLMHRADADATVIVANAESIRHQLFGGTFLQPRVRVIPNIIDVEEFDRLATVPFSRSSELPPGRRVVTVARLDPEKDTATFLRAAALVAASHADVSFVVAGEGRERLMLEALARELGLGTRLVFLGDVKEVPALLRTSHLGVLAPRCNEGLSNSILEYMAAGLPVVATNCGGNAEVVRDGETGFIVPPGDPAAVASALRRALDADSAALGRAGRRLVESRHRPDAVIAQFEQLYRDASGR